MTQYKVTIKTINATSFIVDATDKDEAYEIAQDEFENMDDFGEIVDSETIIKEIKKKEN